jgi:cytochrome c553
MQAHFNDALLIRKAVIAGAREEAANPAFILTQLQDVDELPESWQPFVLQMQGAAARINDSTTESMAAAATADLGLSCGMCHQRNGGPELAVDAPPAAGGSIDDRMKRHVWATERLWEGLFVPSDAAWLAGAQALGPDPFPDEVLQRGGVHARSAANDFGKLAAKAPQKKSATDRANLYAELLVTCGSCHRSLQKE